MQLWAVRTFLLVQCMSMTPAGSFRPLGSFVRRFRSRCADHTKESCLPRSWEGGQHLLAAGQRTARRTQRRRETTRCFFGFGGARKGPPSNYDAITTQAIAAVQAGLAAKQTAMEVEFPPLASLNKVNDGSAKNRGQAQANTLSFAKKLVGALARGRKVWVVCCEPGARGALGKDLKADVRDLASKNLPPAKAGDVQVVITPADQGQWKLAKAMTAAAPVVIVNGVFVNGYMPFEPVYYFKPISGFSTVVGSVVRQYPDPFMAYLRGSNKPVPCNVGLMRQGDVRRPDLRSAANALMTAFQEQQSAQR